MSNSGIKPVLAATARITGLTGSWSPDLMQKAVHRLGSVCLISIIIKAAFILGFAIFGNPFMHRIAAARHLDLGPMHVGAHVFTLVAGFALYRLSRTDRLSHARVLDLGYIYQVLGAMQVAFLTNAGPWPDVILPGFTPAALWALIFALVIPGPPLKMMIATTLTLAADPLAIWVHVQLGMPMPAEAALMDRLVPLIPILFTSLVLSRMVYRMGVQLTVVSEMGSYRLEEKLGEGGMGEVWRASHRFLARPAAVKLIRPEKGGSLANAALLRRFEREAQATAALQSPHTVALYDFGVSDGRFYYVMELLDGLDLETLINRYGPVPPARAVHILAQVCRSLAEAHHRNLVHRDVKPANIFVCRYGGAHDFAKVLDFGLVGLEAEQALQSDVRLTQEGAVIGTPTYMAPELALEGVIRPSVDIYALGCVAFFMLTGRPVFEGRSAMELISQHMKLEPPKASEFSEFEMPQALDEIIGRCLAKDPAERFASVRALGSALEALKLTWSERAAERWWSHHLPAQENSTDELFQVEATPHKPIGLPTSREVEGQRIGPWG
ncbi:MAG: serine/threonine-protein kinase [Bradymonadia bacterium]